MLACKIRRDQREDLFVQRHLRQVAEIDTSDPRPVRLLALINKDYARNRDALADYKESFRRDPNQPGRDEVLLEMADNAKGQHVLDGLGFTGWEPIEQEEMEFMIDLMDTLGAS